MKTRRSRYLLAGSLALLYVGTLTAQSTGRIIFDSTISREKRDVWRMNEDGSSQVNVTALHHDPNDLYEDKDAKLCGGNKIVFSSDKAGRFDVWIMNTDGTGATNVTNVPANKEATQPECDTGNLVFSIVFRGTMDDVEGEIYTISSAGGFPARLTDDDMKDDEPSWCGSKIVFLRQRYGEEESNDIAIMNSDGSNLGYLTCNDYCDGAPSCNAAGTVVAYESAYGIGNQCGVRQIETKAVCTPDAACSCGLSGPYCCNPPTPTVLTTQGGAALNLHPSWSPGGFHITFSSNRTSGGGDYEIYRMDAEDGDIDIEDFHQLTTNTVDDSSPNWRESKQ